MSHHSPRFYSGTMGSHGRRGGQQNPPGRFPPAHPNVFHGEIQRLSYLLEMERAGRFEDNQRLAHLEAELQETKFQLKKQKALKETFINQAKDAKRELERVEKFSDPAVLNAAAIASKIHTDVKCMKKKSLQQDFEELKVAHLLSREAFVAEIQAERKKGQALQEELNQLQTSFEELRSKYEAHDALVRQEAETQTFYEARLSEEQRLLENLRAEKDQMFHEMSQKITLLEDSKQLLQEELTQLKCSYDELSSKYESDVSILKEDVEKYQEELTHEKDANIEREKENLQLINKLRAEKEELSQNMSREITIWQKREKLMLHELDQVHVSHEELKYKYERDILDLEQQVETHQRQIKEERKDCLERIEEDMVLLDKLRAEYVMLQENTTTEIKFLQDKERSAQAELEKVNILYQELNCRYETDVTALKQQAETYQQEISFLKNDLERGRENLLLEDLDNPETKTMQDDKKKKSKISFWKKLQNTLRWKKPKQKQ